MEVAIRYQSRNGNNKLIAESIGKALDVKPEPVTNSLDQKVDILFLGGAVYNMQIDDHLKQFLATLDSKKIGAIVPFASVGIVAVPIRQIKSAAKKKNIKVPATAPIIRLGFSHSARPAKEKLQDIATFAKNLTKKLP